MIRVLVVDDDFMVARIHVGFVERVDGFEVVGTAHTGAEALEAVEELRPDLLLLDLYLPDRFGLDLLAEVRTGPSPCDAIVITAARESDAVRAAVRLGVADYVLKPFGFPDLEERLRRYASQRAVLDRTEVAGQDDVDRVFRRSSSGGAVVLPKGLSPETARLVEEALSSAPDAVSATEVAESVGISRVSARRYLEHFAGVGRADVRLRYGSTGRPERLYRWIG
ncbi:response regulator [Phycicoccus avicenniae]|uniref:response regulator n=1 Tax=Phycicoccus avicenniae TaxID=2828860 RepID=UPI003D2B8E94